MSKSRASSKKSNAKRAANSKKNAAKRFIELCGLVSAIIIFSAAGVTIHDSAWWNNLWPQKAPDFYQYWPAQTPPSFSQLNNATEYNGIDLNLPFCITNPNNVPVTIQSISISFPKWNSQSIDDIHVALKKLTTNSTLPKKPDCVWLEGACIALNIFQKQTDITDEDSDKKANYIDPPFPMQLAPNQKEIVVLSFWLFFHQDDHDPIHITIEGKDGRKQITMMNKNMYKMFALSSPNNNDDFPVVKATITVNTDKKVFQIPVDLRIPFYGTSIETQMIPELGNKKIRLNFVDDDAPNSASFKEKLRNLLLPNTKNN